LYCIHVSVVRSTDSGGGVGYVPSLLPYMSKSLDKHFLFFRISLSLGHYAAIRKNCLSLKNLYGKLEELLYYTSTTRAKGFQVLIKYIKN
jgi:hypothetical protein